MQPTINSWYYRASIADVHWAELICEPFKVDGHISSTYNVNPWDIITYRQYNYDETGEFIMCVQDGERVRYYTLTPMHYRLIIGKPYHGTETHRILAANESAPAQSLAFQSGNVWRVYKNGKRVLVARFDGRSYRLANRFSKG